jgi:putative inorganic carbon (hco3(-)) transporter
MGARAVRRPSPWAWPALGVAALALLLLVRPASLHGSRLALAPVAVAAGVLAARRLWSMHPAPVMCAAIALNVFSGSWSQLGLGGLPLDRLLLAFVVAQFLLCAPGVEHAPRLRVRGVHLLLALTVLYALGSAAAAGTLTSESGALALADQLGIVPFIAFLLAPAVFAGERERNLLLATLVALGAYLGLTAIFETLGPHALVFPRYVLRADTALSEEARAGGPFRAAIAEGFACYACAVAAVIAACTWRDRRARRLAAATALIGIAGCLLTLERGVWIAVLAASLAAALATRAGRRRLVPLALVVSVGLGGALAVSPTLAHDVSTRAGDQSTVWDRQNQVAAGLRMLAVKPLLGFGWERYTSADLEYFRQAPDRPMSGYSHAGYETLGQLLPLHETYLSTAVELGLLGALLWAASLAWGVGGAALERGPPELAIWKAGLLAVFLCFLTIALFNPYQSAFPVLVLWTWAGLARGRAAT